MTAIDWPVAKPVDAFTLAGCFRGAQTLLSCGQDGLGSISLRGKPRNGFGGPAASQEGSG